MSEQLNQERLDGLNTQSSMADRAIAGVVDCYESNLSNGSLKFFRELTDVSEKVDKVCYDYAANPDTRDKAVNLRSWHIVRLLERQYSKIEPGAEWPYYMCLSGSDDFDRRVHSTTSVYIGKMLACEYNLEVKPELSFHDAERNYKETILATDENKAVLKREWLYPDSQEAHTAAFVVKAV